MTNHMMLDLETWGTTPGCAIRSIGAVVFDPQATGVIDQYYANTDDPAGGKDARTVQWWGTQSTEAQSVFSENITPIRVALLGLTKFYKQNNCKRVWCHGAGFDVPIIENTYKRTWLEKEFFTQFFWVRDTRTIYELAGEKPISLPGYETKHHALHDAYNQAIAVQRSYRKLGVK